MARRVARKLRQRIRPLHRSIQEMRLTGLYVAGARVVFPGETLRSWYVQQRVVSEPSNRERWQYWIENGLFYVPLTSVMTLAEIEPWLADRTDYMDTATPKRALLAIANPSSEPYRKAYDAIVDRWYRPQRDITIPSAESDIGGGVRRVALHYGDGRQHGVDLPDLSTVTADLDGDGTIQQDEIIDAWDAWISGMRDGDRTQDYESYLEAAGIRVGGRQGSRTDGQGGQIEVLYMDRSFEHVQTRFDPAAQAFRAYIDDRLEVRRSKDYFFKEPGYLVHLVTVRPTVYDEDAVTYASRMRQSLHWQPREMVADATRVEDSFIAESDTSWGNGADHYHAHLSHVVGETVVGTSESGAPDVGWTVDFSGSVLDTLWPSLSSLEIGVISSGGFAIACQTAARYELDTTCSWPFIGPRNGKYF